MKWTLMLFFLSMIFMILFMLMFYLNNFMIIEYNLSSIYNLDYKFYFMFDWMSCLFSCVVLIISSMVLMYCYSYMYFEKNKISFCWMVLMFVMSMILLILMPNALMLILGWDGLGLVSYVLVIFYQSTNSYNSGMITIISNRIGDAMMIMMIIFTLNFGSFDLLSMNNLEFICEMFIIIAGMTKSAQIPFSAWLPAAMAAPTPVSSLVHSSTLVTAGVYLLIRFDFLFKNEFMSSLLMKISLMTMLMSGINAFLENDLKKIIAFSTLSQLSMMMVILSLGITNLAFFHLIMHAIFKSMLFLGAGFVIHNLLGKQDIRMLPDFFCYSPMIMSCMMISSFSLMGVPFIGGFYSKDLILEYFLMKNYNVINLLAFLIGVIFTFLYNMRLIYFLFLKGTLSSHLIKLNFDFFMKFPIFFLTFLLILVGNLLFWFSIPNFAMIFISKFQKYLSLVLLMTILYVNLNLMKFNFIIPKKIEFFMTMWFLSKLTSLVLLFGSKSFLKMSINDWTWVEMVGPMGLKNMLMKNYKTSIFSGSLSYSKIMVMLMFLLILMN
uniref:NADH dehydrogenase subunit 5 n=1 Tax=Dermacentor reticulatus TaxID=57047 RepID=UPI00226C7806|nr:NADH dehydrogenase subunit 5 [Dermacentor reticulatus]UZG91450.1 NADH dehydrogenase subunit 5 [Dermacentor reticulatus]UZG91463.1 NADH dehydrogenase subunit 5 [Dermacentor reticulatus]UZG91489.1 NADH dehydrogenase subunit 5 [Dermacentor reticulatus]UZG91515.1 NADH dehydrogenase subunit 5 [Dermacentor reticulatus]UZG91541.1 NADH dehydrogenase subunit 5 [Dermacentor reticulatus]